MSGEGTKRAIAAAFVANLGIAVSKFVAFVITGSASMLAESIHSVADTGNQGLLFLGLRRSAKAPTATHQFGYGSERYFWAFVVALVLFSLGAMFSIYEGIQKLIHPHDVESLGVAITVLVIAMILEGFSLRTAVKEATPSRGNASWWAFIRRSKNPELPVVLLEDVGALTGLVLAFIGITLAAVTGNSMWDAIGTLAIGTLLGIIAIVLVIEMKSLLVGESASRADQQQISDAILDGPEVRRIIHLRTLHLGPEELLVATKLDFAIPDVPTLATAVDTVERRIRVAVPIAKVIYIEPDLFRESVEPA
jgi:cation diffusion facilitator family transporter